MAARKLASRAENPLAEKPAPPPKTDHERLLACIDALPKVEREIITLFEIRKKSLSEIAIEQHIEQREIETHLNNARSRLKSLFFQLD
ncbi:MAG: sigma factor-like helix-turn-helix DNA-binding protein [Chloroherpetonaceae bacterium]|nr:sigma factor-like helix-turn-helix DNA-binding protein [Chloroherpetonaceae bacterium]